MPVLGLQMSCVEPSINLIELSLLRNIWCLSKLELERTSNKCIIIKKNLRLLENRMKIGHKVFIHANIWVHLQEGKICNSIRLVKLQLIRKILKSYKHKMMIYLGGIMVISEIFAIDWHKHDVDNGEITIFYIELDLTRNSSCPTISIKSA